MNLIYLCGPVSGRPTGEALRHFNGIEQKILGNAGSSQVPIFTNNPMRLCLPDLEWHKSMRRCVARLTNCDGIALLQGWQKSRGATLELELAEELHIPVVYIEPPVECGCLSEIFAAAPEALRYYNARLQRFQQEGMNENLAEERVLAELSNRYLDPYGFEYRGIAQEG
ncbi:MAG: DUF4406 domain-containing protein [Treponema sp.]|jgi:hypothetical protein|nr:DUF4406 domain-containing protein [Treponema sp.]